MPRAEPYFVGFFAVLKGASVRAVHLMETGVSPRIAMDNETAIKLIKLYEGHRVLWDPLNKKFYDKNVKQDAWNDISSKLGIAVDAIKKKMTSLTGSYRREKSRHKNSLATGSGNFFVNSCN